MNAKYDYELPKVCFKYDESPEKEVQEGEEKVMASYIKVEGCENGYLLTLVEYVDDDWNREEIQWVATTTGEMKKIFDTLIDDIKKIGVE